MHCLNLGMGEEGYYSYIKAIIILCIMLSMVYVCVAYVCKCAGVLYLCTYKERPEGDAGLN